MKKTNFKSLFYLAISSLAFTGALTGCSVDEFIANKDLVEKLEKFHFNTSEEVNIDIDYGPLASRALVQVYEENPLANATEDDQAPKGQTVFTTFLDENGRFKDEVAIPAHIKHLYFYSSSMAAPTITDAELNGKSVKVTSLANKQNATRATRVVDDNQLVVRKLTTDNELKKNADNFYSIVGGWDNYGKPEDPNHLIDEGHLTADDVLSIEHYFWDGNSVKTTTAAIQAKHKAMRVENVNMVVQEKYEENGETYDVEHAEVWFTFLTEYAWNENTVGYYFFDRNNPPSTAAQIDRKFIILPNASKGENQPFLGEGYGSCDRHYFHNWAPTHMNQRIQLLYVDKNGNASKYFPPNIEIGFFLISNGMEKASGTEENIGGKNYTTRVNGKINPTGTTYYSNYKFNGGREDDKRFVACRLANNTVVYGAEDGSDWSYDDLLFTITATPEKALHTHENSNLTSIPAQQVPRKYTDKSETCTYLFEDIWPDGGDYDLNDVVVRLNRTITKDQFNFVSKVVDKFKFEVNQWTASSCAFAVQTSYPGDTYELPNGAWFEEETNSFFLVDDARNVRNQTLTLTRYFTTTPVPFEIIQKEQNPFIVNQSMGVDCRQDDRIEIHIVGGDGNEVTSKGKKIDNAHNPAKAWYISDDGKYPFALKISGTSFVPCDERVRIGSVSGAYPNFNKWVDSNGKSYTDWYKNK